MLIPKSLPVCEVMKKCKKSDGLVLLICSNGRRSRFPVTNPDKSLKNRNLIIFAGNVLPHCPECGNHVIQWMKQIYVELTYYLSNSGSIQKY